MRAIQVMQCEWCGGKEVTKCLTCNHMSCDNCGAGGDCMCVVTELMIQCGQCGDTHKCAEEIDSDDDGFNLANVREILRGI